MAKKSFFAILDTETTMENTVADFAIIIVDRKGIIHNQCAVMIKGHYDRFELFHDKAANDIWESEFGIDSNVDTQDVRNIIIDILTSGSVSNYKKSFNESLGIKGLKQDLIEKEEELKLEREKAKVTTAELKASQLSLFDTNAPAGKPAIKRTKKSCD